MKNIFDYATNELSQDAFLSWLFENYDCENEKVREATYLLLNSFCDLNMVDHEIIDLKTYRQYGKMDIIVKFIYNETIYLTVIEDKTYSREHNQLEKYNKILENKKTKKYFFLSDKNVKIFKVFYKTDVENEKDVEACNRAGWKTYFINNIADLFLKLKETQNEILDDYIEHIMTVADECNNISDKPVMEWTKINFRTFFEKEVLPEIYKKSKLWKQNYEVGFPDFHQYYSVTFPYIIPNTQYRINMEVVSRTTNEGFNMLIRISDLRGNDEVTVDSAIKNKLRQLFIKHGKENMKSRDNKWTLVNGSDTLNHKLKYDRGCFELKDELIKLVMMYEDICLKINDNF